jgi:hypothetical protein
VFFTREHGQIERSGAGWQLSFHFFTFDITGPPWQFSSARLRTFMKIQNISAVLAFSILFAGCGKKSVSSGTSLLPAKEQTNTVSVAVAADSTNSPVFQIRLVLDTPSANSEPMSISNGVDQVEVVNLQKKVLLDQTAIKSAKVVKDNLGHPQIAINFTESGREQFAEVTRENIGKRLAIVIDGRVYSAPVVMSEISGGANITGSFSEQEAEELAKRLNPSLK